MTTPADQLQHAVNLGTEAIARMTSIGAPSDALADVIDAIDNLASALGELPGRLAETDNRFCSGCEHALQSVSYEPYGDHAAPLEWMECIATKATQCHLVRACGFHDPEQPELLVPAFLRRQAT